jgi:hypothetical protein
MRYLLLSDVILIACVLCFRMGHSEDMPREILENEHKLRL